MNLAEMIRLEMQSHSWLQLDELFLAFILSSIIGLEREIKLKSAGLRTHALVGLGAAVMMLVSKYGFYDSIGDQHVGLDPSRVAAQIVSGIGFIGGGLIFVRKDIVHGLTTAATIWLTAGVGMACGGGLPILALAATFGHLVIAIGFTRVMHRVLGVTNRMTVRYKKDAPDVASRVLAQVTAHGFTIRAFNMKTDYADPSMATLLVRAQGTKSVAMLSEKLMKIQGVVSVGSNTAKEDE